MKKLFFLFISLFVSFCLYSQDRPIVSPNTEFGDADGNVWYYIQFPDLNDGNGVRYFSRQNTTTSFAGRIIALTKDDPNAQQQWKFIVDPKNPDNLIIELKEGGSQVCYGSGYNSSGPSSSKYFQAGAAMASTGEVHPIAGKSALCSFQILDATIGDGFWLKDMISGLIMNKGSLSNGTGGSATGDATSTVVFIPINEPTTTVSVTGVDLNKAILSLNVNVSEQLIATVLPDNATDVTVTWSSSNSSVATVEDGLVTAKQAGTTTITVTTKDGDFSASCEVTVTPATPQPTGSPVIISPNTEFGDANGNVWYYIQFPDLNDGNGVRYFSRQNTTTSFAGRIIALTKDDPNAQQQWKFIVDPKNPDNLIIELKEGGSQVCYGSGYNSSGPSSSKYFQAGAAMASTGEVHPIAGKSALCSFQILDATIGDGFWLKDMVSGLIMNKGSLSNGTGGSADGDATSTVVFVLVGDGTSIDVTEVENLKVRFSDGSLYVNNAVTEDIYVYSVLGNLISKSPKGTGETVLPIKSNDNVLIVKGSSGWVKKVIKQK